MYVILVLKKYIRKGMKRMECSKKDWNLFKSKIASWQESYMEKLNKEYMEILSGNESASDRFWKLEERIKKDRKRKGVIISLQKSDMVFDLIALLHDGAIEMADLEEFSEEVREMVKRFM